IEAIDLGGSKLVSARVLNHQPARTRPLDEVRDEVRSRLVAQRSAEMAQEDGAAQLEALRQGGDETSMRGPLTVSRDQPGDLPRPVLDAVLSADPKQLPAWQGVKLGDQGYAVVKVEQVLPRTPREDAATRSEVEQYNQWWAAA